ncbi:centrosomal protein CCDC61 isoform X1 [Poecile atricapillus]|uniref:centrosomal protein CCDC61 isoform X1 n=1 Tax=Poecile atricapillus TaxID=48891 RepID=UPI0027397C5C|nr:centrosomal protein CCDC61 isoform X1 [Poecile atricapillus]XP_058708366.1 centrosomal protein CCDC61 isoform X1 [Poecile atricapillus]
MGEPRYLQAECAFRPGAHSVRVTLSRCTLRVEVEAHGTADLWRGEFDAAFIEDLTRKTGNFKQFGIFCSMLESALTQSSDSVSLELLTYTDLETLHSRKVGAVTRPLPSTSSSLNTKRYLILIYSVEFDRIHYPLPLPYVGRPDLAAVVRELQEQLAQLRARRLEETQHLRDALWQALEEKRAAEARHQREYRQLAAELTQAKASEQRLQLRVKNLTAELASCRRGRQKSASPAPRPKEQRSASLESHRSSRGRPSPQSLSPAGSHRPRFDPTAFVRNRQRQQKEAELRSQRHGVASGSASPARSHRRSSSAESSRSWRLGGSSGSKASERLEPVPCRDRRVTRKRRPLSTSSCNGPCVVPHTAASHKLPACRTGGKRPGKENHSKEHSAELAEIDARLQALQEYMDSLNTRM